MNSQDETKYVVTTPDKPDTEFIVSLDDDNKKIKEVVQRKLTKTKQQQQQQQQQKQEQEEEEEEEEKKKEKEKERVISDEDIQKAWQRIRSLDLAVMKDGTYQLAVTSPSNTKVPNIDLFISRRMTKKETYNHLTRVYEKMKSCPVTGNQIIHAPFLDRLVDIKKLI